MGSKKLRAAVAIALVSLSPGLAHAASEQQNLEELRNTVINLLQALVDQGVMTREKAAQLVKQAQEKAAVDAAAAAKKDEGAVRVPYVPQIVKDEIAKEVADQVKPQVVDGVVQQAKTEGWGVPGAMPEWLSRVTVSGDVRVRAQGDFYSKDNATGYWYDYNAINTAGGLNKAVANGTALLNVKEDNERLRVRARLGAVAELSPSWEAGVRVSTGSATDPSSESQTLGTTAERYVVGFDQAFIRYTGHTADGFTYATASAGRFANPWFAPTELVYARDLTFEGLAATGRVSYGDGSGKDRSNAFLTVGVFPIQNVPLATNESKWMVGAQLGDSWLPTSDDKLTVAAAYYDFIHVSGVANPVPGSNALNYTAPAFVRWGNSMFAINTVSATDLSPGLYGLAARFRIVDLAGGYTHSFGRYGLGINGEAVRNVGYNSSDIFRRTGLDGPTRNKGYVFDVAYGDPALDRLGQWRATLGYRYVQRDAVLDAWTDADFHEGGTNAQGYYLAGDFGLSTRTWLRVRYLSGNEIDSANLSPYGSPASTVPAKYGVDILQVDLNAKF